MAITVQPSDPKQAESFRLGPESNSTIGSPPDPPVAPPGRPWMWAGAILAGAVALVVLFLMLFDWNLLRGPISRFASERMQRPVRIEGDLDVKLLTFTPTVRVEGLKIGNPAWAPQVDMADIPALTVSTRLLSLLRGQVLMPLVRIDRPTVALLRDGQGRANWALAPPKPGAEPLKLPPIQNFIIDRGHLSMTDQPRRLTFNGTVDARERITRQGGEGFRFTGKGELNRRPFLMNVWGGPLLNVEPNRAYPFNAEITADATRIQASGQLPKPFNLGLFGANFTISGRDLNQLYYLTGLALPNTPPYSAKGRLTRDGAVYTVAGLNGRVGGSDISGDLKVDTKGERPLLTGALRSRTLNFRDLGSLFGAPSAAPTATPEERAVALAMRAKGKLLPDATLQTERLRAMDADVRYRAQSVTATGDVPLRAVDVGVKLEAGVLRLDPIEFDFPQGRLAGTARIDARKATPVSAVDLRLTNAQAAQFLPRGSGPPPLAGTVMARARLTGAGNSIHKAAASSDGTATLVMPSGQVRQLFAELMGIDATKSLFLLLAKDNSPTPIRCAVAKFDVKNGIMTADRVVFDTGVVLVTGTGTVDLGRETYDLEFKGKPKKFRLVRIKAPITVGGPLRQPKFGIEPGKAVAQAGIGAALGAVLSPLAAILPFVDPGLAKDANCAGLLAEAKAEGGVQVKTAGR